MSAVKPAGNIRIVKTPTTGGDEARPVSNEKTEGFFGSPLHAIQASLDLIKSGGRLPSVAENVRKHIEGLMAAEGRRLASELPPIYREKLNDAIDSYRSAGRTESELNGLRLAVAQKLTKMIG